MSESRNRIFALGVPAGGNLFQRGATVPLGAFGAIVVGRNGAGKTRFLRNIGSEHHLIYDHEGLSHFFGLVTPDDPEQPWDVPDDDHPLFHPPQKLYLKVRQLLEELAVGRRLSELGIEETAARTAAASVFVGLDSARIEVVAAIFASLNFLDPEPDQPHFIYLLALSLELAEIGRIGVIDSGQLNGASISLWYNDRPDVAPYLSAVLDALQTYEGKRIQIEFGNSDPSDQLNMADSLADESSKNRKDAAEKSGYGLSYLDPISLPENDDLHNLAERPATALGFVKMPGVLEYHTWAFPMRACGRGNPVLHCDDGTLPLEGERVVSAGRVSKKAHWTPDLDKSYRFLMWFEKPDINDDAPEGVEAARLDDGPLRLALDVDVPNYTFDRCLWDYGAVLSRVASEVIRLLLPTAPEILLIDRAGELRWVSRVAGRTFVSIDELSNAEQRWVRFAIRLADRYLDRLAVLVDSPDVYGWIADNLVGHDPGISRGLEGQVVVIDEPEQGVHRAAEETLAVGLVSLANLVGFKPIVATHSPTFVRHFIAAGANTVRVHRDATGGGLIETMEPNNLQLLGEACGLAAADVLQLVRTFLLVEGEHDRAVLSALFGDELAQLGVAVVPFRGAHGISQVVDASVLWSVGARVVVLLDHLDNDSVQTVWRAALESESAGRRDDALQTLEKLDRLPRSGKAELKAVREVFTHAITSGEIARLSVHGLTAHDIINYFHPGEILLLDEEYRSMSMDRSQMWKRLSREWNDAGRPRGFKGWLEDRFPDTRLDAASLADAVSRWDSIPADLSDLLDDLRRTP